LLQLNLPSTLFHCLHHLNPLLPFPNPNFFISLPQISRDSSRSVSSHCCFIHIAIFVPVSLDSISVFRRASFHFLAFFPHCFLETGSCGSVPLNLCFFLFPCVINSDNINISYNDNNNTVLANFAASIMSLVCQIWFSFCSP